jgi:hypothetical protein
MADTPNINDIAAKLQQFAERTLKIESSSSRIDHITKSIAAQYGAMAQKNAVVGLGFTKLTSGMSGKSKEMAEIQALLTKALINQNNVMARRERMMDQTLTIQTKIDKVTGSSKANKAELLGPLQKQLSKTTDLIISLDQESEKLGQQIEHLRTVAAPAATGIGRLGLATKALSSAAFLTGFASLVNFSNELNKSVIKTNANISARRALLDATLDTQLNTGASAKALLDANQEMVSIGARIIDNQIASTAQTAKLLGGAEMTRKTYAETLKTTVMLVEGLGASAHEAVQLQITARAANVSYNGLADTISKIVDSTALAADEAMRYARQLAVADRIASGAAIKFDNKVFKQNLTVLAGIEGAMKDNIGAQGEIAELLGKFTSYSKLGGLGTAFGTGGIDFLRKQGDGVGKVMGNIARQVEGASGPMLEAYANMLQVRPETLIALSDEYKKAQQAGLSFQQYYAERQKLLADDSDLQTRYNKQLSLQGETFSRLGKILVVLAGSALTPLLQGLNWFSTQLMKVFKLLGPDGPLGPIGKWLKVGFSIIASGYLITKLWSATTALFAFTASLVRLTKSLQASATSNLITSAVTGVGGKGGGAKGVAGEAVKDIASMTIMQKIIDSIGKGFGKVKGLFGRSPVGKVAVAAGSQAIQAGWFKSLFTKMGGFFGSIKESMAGWFKSSSKTLSVNLPPTSKTGGFFNKAAKVAESPLTKAEGSTIANFFRGLMTNTKGFFGKIFGRVAAVEAAETVTGMVSKGIITRVLGSVVGFLGATFLKGVIGRILAWVLGVVVGGIPGLIIGLLITIIPMLWPHIKNLFGGGKSKDAGVDIHVEDFEKKATDAFMKTVLSGDKEKIAIQAKAYDSLLRKQGKSAEEIAELNARIVERVTHKVEVKSASIQRDQVVGKTDIEGAKEVIKNREALEKVSNTLEIILKSYQKVEKDKKKAEDERAEETLRYQMVANANPIS